MNFHSLWTKTDIQTDQLMDGLNNHITLHLTIFYLAL